MIALKLTLDTKNIPCQASDLQSFNEVWKQLTSRILKQGKFIYQVIIDEQVFYDGYEEHIVNQFKHIQHIEITTKDKEEARRDSMMEVLSYNGRLMAATDQVSAAFYGEPTQEQWGVFAQFIEGLQWLSQSLQFIQTISIEPERHGDLQQQIDEVLNTLSEKVGMLDQASEDKDYTLMGDIIQYEFSEIFEQIDQVLGGTV